MSFPYKVEVIGEKEKERIMERMNTCDLIERKSTIHGTCIKFFTDNHEFKDMWEDNFEPMQDWIRPHVRLYAIKGRKLRIRYAAESKTIVIEGCDYYGWVKSIALGLVADFLEDFPSEHRRNSVHGSFVDFGGHGLALIGPSGSGKTTLTYGLLLDQQTNFLTDDWFFVRFTSNGTLIYSSEKNSYIRGDLGKVWEKYTKGLDGIKEDARNRAIVEVKRLIGNDRIRTESNLVATVILTRNPQLPAFSSLTQTQAIKFLMENEFCNPHQLIRTKQKIEKRRRFFLELLKKAPVYLLNTIETPKESLSRLKELMRKSNI
ncbi:hypothetical protein HY990_04700 [Candidatus Micrarchaeota archaeon]|nr:hypothetical protein [Candidatus Micrarchaeota archaeon]